jgi:hypothetical protein
LATKNTKIKFYDKSWAIIIAIDKYRHVSPLRNAVNDGRRIASTMRNIGFDEIIELYNSHATKQTIMSLLIDDENLPSKVQKEDRILVFFAGHGISIPNKRNNSISGFIVPYDGDIKKITSLIDFNDFVKKSIDNLLAKHVVFLLDCCFSGIAAVRSIPTDRPPIPAMPINDYLQTCTSKRTIQVIAAGGTDELVLDQNILTDHSPFTQSVISGLHSWEADLDKNGIVTSTELAVYLSKKVSDMANVYGHKQRPIANRLPGDDGGDFVFRVAENILHETIKEFRERLNTLSVRECVTIIKSETGSGIKALLIENDVVAISYTSYTINIKQLQLELVSIISIIARMFVPRSQYQVTIEKPNIPLNREGTDTPELLSVEIPTSIAQSYMKKEISLEEMWPRLRFFVKISNIYSLELNEMSEFDLVI